MKKNARKAISGILLVVMLLSSLTFLAGCGGSSGLIGTWESTIGGDVATLEFLRNGNLIYSEGDFTSTHTWEASEGTLVIRFDSGGEGVGTYQIVGSSLILDFIEIGGTWTRR